MRFQLKCRVSYYRYCLFIVTKLWTLCCRLRCTLRTAQCRLRSSSPCLEAHNLHPREIFTPPPIPYLLTLTLRLHSLLQRCFNRRPFGGWISNVKLSWEFYCPLLLPPINRYSFIITRIVYPIMYLKQGFRRINIGSMRVKTPSLR